MAKKTHHSLDADAALEKVVQAFCAISHPPEMRRFFHEIFTPTERHDLALRWELMQRLRTGETQRRIAAGLRISLCKITRGSKVLKHPDSVCRRLLEQEQP